MNVMTSFSFTHLLFDVCREHHSGLVDRLRDRIQLRHTVLPITLKVQISKPDAEAEALKLR